MTTTRDLAQAFAALRKEGRHDEAGERYWSPDIVSIEAMEGPMHVCRGLLAVKAKGDWWNANHEVNGGTTDGPFVNGDQSALRFTMDITEKATGKRVQMEEIGLSTVRDGKVVEERFFY
ncbi:MAG TPA: nuclear transport factor 2 family protein [Acetobacteraceae bacterium]|nr:nuclear transport factor 2 family protein [Acetobacteraceae bacterium]